MQHETESTVSELVVGPPRSTTDTGEKLHLALLIYDLFVGGVQRSMLTLAEGLAERGHRVDLVVMRPKVFFDLTASPLLRVVSIEHWWTRLPLIGWWNRTRAIASPPAIARYLRTVRPDVLLSASHYVNLAAILGRQLAGTDTPLVISQRIHLSQAIANTRFPPGWRPLLKWMVRRYYRKADAILAVSAGVAEDLAAVASLPRRAIRVIYNPVVTPGMLGQASAPMAHPWFLPGEPPIILGVGRLIAQKDFATLIRAFARVLAHRPVRLMILGEGNKRRELEELADSLGVHQSLTLPGYAENPFAYMARAAVFVLSSRFEGLPGVLIQAMACGCPVVSTDCASGPREILERGAYGPLVPVGDDKALAEAIQTVLDKPASRERLMACASEYGVDRAVEQHLQVLFEVYRRKSAYELPAHARS
jgi:glycosyltransferase involved in cell wall biosynthesis